MQSETLFRSWNKLLSSEDETLENETTDNVTDSEVTELTTLSNCFGFDLSESEKASWLADVLGFGCVIVIRGCSKGVWRERDLDIAGSRVASGDDHSINRVTTTHGREIVTIWGPVRDRRSVTRKVEEE